MKNLIKSSYYILIIALLVSCDFNSKEYYFKEARKMEEQNRLMDAISLHSKAINKDTDFLPSYLNRGADKSMVGDYKGGNQRL